MIANLDGQWRFIEHPFRGDPEGLLDQDQSILIKLNANGNFDVSVPLRNEPNATELKDLPPVIDEKLRPTLSRLWTNDKGSYGLRLVFDIGSSGIEMVEGPLGSTVERWNIVPVEQPDDMGVITGTKG